MNRATLTGEQWGCDLPFSHDAFPCLCGGAGRLPSVPQRGAVDSPQWRPVAISSAGSWPLEHGLQAVRLVLPVWADLHAHVAGDSDLQHVLMDSTILRAHACAVGARSSAAEDEALGCSQGGFTTKVHALTDALGNPLKFILTGGQCADIDQAGALLAEVTNEAVIADKGYDSDALVHPLATRQTAAVIPSRSNRNNPRIGDGHLYKERHLIECCFGKIKYYRRVFSRFEKTARNFRGFLQFVGTLIWTR